MSTAYGSGRYKMYEFKCLNCGKSATLPSVSCTPKKFCNRNCYREYIAKYRKMPDTKPRINSRPQAAPAKAGASDTSQQLVDPKLCRKCVYCVTQSNIKHCGYMFIKRTTRTALHPEGLTSTCYEFEPRKKRGRPKKQGMTIKR